jgi:large subunit ribosomal protein L25
LGNKLYTSELKSDNYIILHPDNTVVCQVRTSRASMQLDDEIETAEGTEEGTTEEGGDGKSEGEATPDAEN